VKSLIKNFSSDRRGQLLASQFLVAGISFFALYFSVIQKLVQDWETNQNFSHGYFIPFISIAMIYSMRDRLREIEIRPSNLGLLVLAAGLLQYYIAVVGSEYFLQRSSMIIVLLGMALFLGGKSLTRIVICPLLYLFLMIPIPAVVWSNIAFPMQLFSSMIAEKAIAIIGIPILREGNILHLSETTLEVVDACSGLRSLTSMLTLSLALAFFTNTTRVKRAVIVLAALPIAVLVNIVRLTGTAMLASKYGAGVAQGFLHDFSGWLVFVLGLALLWSLTELLTRGEKKSTK